MTISSQIRLLCARLNISKAELARRLGYSPQNLNAKMKRESFTVAELDQIADVTSTVFSRSFVLPNGEKL